MGTEITKKTLNALKIVTSKTPKNVVDYDLALDYQVIITDKKCPGCGSGNLICCHKHLRNIGPIHKKPNDLDVRIHCCDNPECNYYSNILDDYPDTPEGRKKFPRPDVCPVCGQDLNTSERVFNNSDV